MGIGRFLAMANAKYQMEYGKWLRLRNFACLLILSPLPTSHFPLPISEQRIRSSPRNHAKTEAAISPVLLRIF
jgi:hypothetical protein